jgi:NAD(P)H dehydrogenase (quinone)
LLPELNHGIFNYCGAQVVTSELLLDSETLDPIPRLQAARAVGRNLFYSREADHPMA